jgi:membrane protease YdiL (CAAX protease family)
MHNARSASDIKLSSVIFLHFAPAAAIAAVYLLLSSLAPRVHMPRLLALMIAFVFAGIPLQLAIIRNASRRAGHSVVTFRKRLPLWQHVAGALLLIAIDFALLRLPLGRVSEFLATHVFKWLPVAFSPGADDDLAGVGRGLLLAVLVTQLVIDGIVNPIVEERYFRGFLLPSLGRWRGAAPVASTLFFALAHFWQPYNVVSIFAFVLPLTLFTWWRRNYYTQAFVHCFANSLGATMALVAFFK